MSAKRTRQPSKSRKAARRPSAAAPPRSPATIGSDNRGVLFFLAVDRVRTNGGPGKRSAVYRAPESLLAEIAEAHVHACQTVRDLWERLGDELLAYGVSQRTLERWLPKVRLEYRTVSTEHLRRRLSENDLDVYAGDPMRLAGATVLQLAVALHGRLRSVDLSELASKDANAITAMVREITGYAETHANAEYLRARVRKIEAAVQHAQRQLAGDDAEDGEKVRSALGAIMEALGHGSETRGAAA